MAIGMYEYVGMIFVAIIIWLKKNFVQSVRPTMMCTFAFSIIFAWPHNASKARKMMRAKANVMSIAIFLFSAAALQRCPLQAQRRTTGIVPPATDTSSEQPSVALASAQSSWMSANKKRWQKEVYSRRF